MTYIIVIINISIYNELCEKAYSFWNVYTFILTFDTPTFGPQKTTILEYVYIIIML